MADRLDLLIFGATGFTGIHCIPFVHILSKSDGRNLSWGVAGRSEGKLKDTLEQMSKKIGEDLSKIPIIIADIKDEESLLRMARSTKVVINCCGPYRLLGESVIQACIEADAHQVDLSGEPAYIESIQLEYNNAAAEKGIYIINACGLDSIPTDLGIIYLQKTFTGVLNSVVTYLEVWDDGTYSGPTANYGTWESAVYGTPQWWQLINMQKNHSPKKLPDFMPKLKPKYLPHHSELVEGWVLPFPGADRSVIKRTQRYFYETKSRRPVQVDTLFVVKSFTHLIFLAIGGTIFGILAQFGFGRRLLLNFPEFFSFGTFAKVPPTEDKIENTSFQVTFYGEGWKEKIDDKDHQYTKSCNRAILGKVKGKNPAYGATCACLVGAAIMIATESDKMPGKGGVLTPGAAFEKTSLIKLLNKNGVIFDIVSTKDI